MKHIRVALALCALPATAFAQNVSCNACDHVAPYFRGNGGFIGTVAAEAEEVTFVAFCGSVSTTGQAAVNGRTASLLFTDRNGLACDRDGGALEIAGLEDGGWYWINDVDNSAVGNLVSADVLGNETTEITNAGDSVSMTVGRGAVFLKHRATGRVGILPNILPEPAATRPRSCGAYRVDRTTVRQYAAECALGDGSATVRIVGPAGFGRREPITNGVVYRKVRDAVTVQADLWSEGGVITTNATATPVGTGYLGLGGALSLSGVSLESSGLGATIAGALGAGNDSPTVTQDSDGNDIVNLTIEDATASDYCTDDTRRDATITIGLTSDQGNLVPPVKPVNDAGQHGRARLTIRCPPSAAN